MRSADHAQHGPRRADDSDDIVPIQGCAWPGCDCPGDYRAPKSRTALRDFHWFCLEHVRRYNAAWNYFDGLDADQIEAIRQGDATWHRPTWPLGARASATAAADGFEDLLNGGDEAPSPPASPEREKALASLGLGKDASPNEVKARYKALAKRHHPDANGGCKRAEERLKTINEAYSYLRNSDAAH